MMERGAGKLQMYYVGPKTVPIMRTTPYADQAQTFDRLYPGHNAANFWDFFFPGVYEGWQEWIKNPDSRPIKTSFITATAPYIDAITGKLIVSFFRPLWTADRKDVAGMTAADVTLEQLAEIVEGVRLADTGFAFLAQSDSNVIAVKSENEARLGLKIGSAAGQGVTGLNRKLSESTQAGVAGLALPSDEKTIFATIMIQENGVDVPYLVALHRLSGVNLWDAGKIRGHTREKRKSKCLHGTCFAR
jgi:sigma-B regulation protein RsbU (phosphoserine phosphatase)